MQTLAETIQNDIEHLFEADKSSKEIEQPILADKISSDIEDFLDTGCVVPILGALPALTKSIFGAVQFVTALLTFVASLPYSWRQLGQDMFFHSLRHIVHGLSNILSGLTQAIPLVGSLICVIRLRKLIGSSDADVRYRNDQSHKFFGYKTLADTSWKKLSLEDETETDIQPNEISNGGTIEQSAFCL